MTIVTTARRRFQPVPPKLSLTSRSSTAVLKVAANGVEYRAMIELDNRKRASSVEIAMMLERMAGYIRRDDREARS
jgi:hypothetical protein